MIDDWSLEGKEINEPDCERCSTEKIYGRKNIETLRNNLIEDIDSIDCTDKSKLSKYQIIEEVLEILDKRFGVEHGKE